MSAFDDASGAPNGGAATGGKDNAARVLPVPRRRPSRGGVGLRSSVATGNLVWIANPKSGRVALVDASTLQVRTVEAGNGPTYVASVPGQSAETALVLNVLSEDATLLGSHGAGDRVLDIQDGEARQLGRLLERWAIRDCVGGRPQGAERTEDAGLPRPHRHRPRRQDVDDRSRLVTVRSPSDSQRAETPRAYAVTQDGVAIIDLSGLPTVKKNVAISDTPNEDPGTRDVFVTKDGAARVHPSRRLGRDHDCRPR